MVNFKRAGDGAFRQRIRIYAVYRLYGFRNEFPFMAVFFFTRRINEFYRVKPLYIITQSCNAAVYRYSVDYRYLLYPNAYPEISNFYIHIRSNEGPYKRKFIKLYNDKCVYCGNSLDNINIALFEIDHYINEASFSSDNKNEANVIENLVPSCQKCNRGKNGLTITGEYIHILHPEESELLKVQEQCQRHQKFKK